MQVSNKNLPSIALSAAWAKCCNFGYRETLVCYWHVRLVVSLRCAIAAIARAEPIEWKSGCPFSNHHVMHADCCHPYLNASNLFLATDGVSSASKSNQHHLHCCHEAHAMPSLSRSCGHITTTMRYAPQRCFFPQPSIS